LAGNQINQISPEIAHFSTLHSLDLENNQINAWSMGAFQIYYLSPSPIEFYQLKNLELLNLKKNKITGISPEIKQLDQLRDLNLLHNPLPETEKR
jgi:Leucine-rich repeat (LRR) protein